MSKEFQENRLNWRKEKLVNLLMRNGKKQKAQNILKEAMLYIQSQNTKNFSEVLQKAVLESSSIMQLKSRRHAAQQIRVPFPLSLEQQESSGLRRLVKEARSIKGRPMGEKLGQILLKASEGMGQSVEEQKRERKEIRKNRGNLFLRW